MEDSPNAKELRALERAMALQFGWTEHVDGPYSTLPTPTSIRLLEVAPGDTIQCSFKIVDLDDLPSYNALSYTWGNPRGVLPPEEDVEADRIAMNTTYSVLCDGKYIDVSANCHAFLKSFQKLRVVADFAPDVVADIRFTANDVWIWIDAICINQNSLIERASQVRIMHRVYRQASKVPIWLGPADSLSREGSMGIIRLNEAFYILRDRAAAGAVSADSLSKLIGRPGKSPLLREANLPDITSKQWQGIITLLRRTWFTRAW